MAPVYENKGSNYIFYWLVCWWPPSKGKHVCLSKPLQSQTQLSGNLKSMG